MTAILGAFVDRLEKLLDPQFIVAFWLPVVVGLACAFGVAAAISGPGEIGDWWDAHSTTEQLLLVGPILIASGVVAFLLQGASYAIVRLYEGYWPGRASWAVAGVKETFRRLVKAKEVGKDESSQDAARSRLYFEFPPHEGLLLPTRLGNVLRAAEEYSYRVYGVDAAIWWPRLSEVMTDRFRASVQGAFIPMVALLNLTTAFLLVALLGGGVLVVMGDRWEVFVAVFVGGLVTANFCYRAAVAQAGAYGRWIRAAFDLYRHDLLEKIGLEVPAALGREYQLWRALNHWVYNYWAPWTTDQHGLFQHKAAAPSAVPKP